MKVFGRSKFAPMDLAPVWREYLSGGWRRYLVGEDVARIELGAMHPSVCCGIYFLFDGARLVYVGLSVQCTERVSWHSRRTGKVFDAWGAIAVPEGFLLAVETAYMDALRPALNDRYLGGRHPNHEEMVDAIRELWPLERRLQHRNDRPPHPHPLRLNL